MSVATAVSKVDELSQLSQAATKRLNKPQRRGMFRDLDAARAQLGKLTVADTSGQARVYWLIDLNTQIIEDARFLAFGHLASHPISDCWSDLIRGQSITEACEMPLETIEAALRDADDQPAFAGVSDPLAPLAFIADIQAQAKVAFADVKLLPKPSEIVRYQRKRELEWDDRDRAWLPLSLMKKVMRVQDTAAKALAERYAKPISWAIEGLHDDFRVVVDFSKASTPDAEPVPADQRPTLIRFLEEALRSDLHPAMVVEEQT